MSNRGFALLGAALTIALASCGKEDESAAKPALSQHEKDSIYANSQIPGAKAVKKAMTVADSATARQGRMVDTTPETP
jgi:hypothetical protein